MLEEKEKGSVRGRDENALSMFADGVEIRDESVGGAIQVLSRSAGE